MLEYQLQCGYLDMLQLLLVSLNVFLAQLTSFVLVRGPMTGWLNIKMMPAMHAQEKTCMCDWATCCFAAQCMRHLTNTTLLPYLRTKTHTLP